MPNAPMGKPEYIAKNKIEMVRIPIFAAHSARRSASAIVEYEDIIKASYSYNVEEWKEMHIISWAVQCFHMLGLSKHVAVYLNGRYGLPYMSFYRALIAYALSASGSHIGGEIARLRDLLEGVLEGRGFDQFIDGIIDISWPAEEASFIRFMPHLDAVFDELSTVAKGLALSANLPIDLDELGDVLAYQRAVIVSPDDKGTVEFELGFNVHEYIQGLMTGGPVELARDRHLYRIERGDGFGGDMSRFAQNVVWYGRKGGRFNYLPTPIGLFLKSLHTGLFEAFNTSYGMASLADGIRLDSGGYSRYLLG